MPELKLTLSFFKILRLEEKSYFYGVYFKMFIQMNVIDIAIKAWGFTAMSNVLKFENKRMVKSRFECFKNPVHIVVLLLSAMISESVSGPH